MASRPLMIFLLVCALLALTLTNFVSASGSVSGVSPPGSMLCAGVDCLIPKLDSVISGTSIGLHSLLSSTSGMISPPIASSVTSLSSYPQVSTLSTSSGAGMPTSVTQTISASSVFTRIEPTPVFHPCSDNNSFLCLGTVTDGTFAGPPTPRSSSPAVLLTPTQSPSSVLTTQLDPSPETEISTLTLSPSSTAATNTHPPSTSTFYSTSQLPDITVSTMNVITSTKVGASLQTSGASGRPTTMFSLIWIILAHCKSTLATWTTKSAPAMQIFCTEDPRHGCYEGTPMTVIWQAEKSSNDAQKHVTTSMSTTSPSLTQTSNSVTSFTSPSSWTSTTTPSVSMSASNSTIASSTSAVVSKTSIPTSTSAEDTSFSQFGPTNTPPAKSEGNCGAFVVSLLAALLGWAGFFLGLSVQ